MTLFLLRHSVYPNILNRGSVVSAMRQPLRQQYRLMAQRAIKLMTRYILFKLNQAVSLLATFRCLNWPIKKSFY